MVRKTIWGRRRGTFARLFGVIRRKREWNKSGKNGKESEEKETLTVEDWRKSEEENK